MGLIRLKLTKGAGKGDTATYVGPANTEILQILPKQGILPQPLVDYVVEKLFSLRGAIRAAVEGEAVAFSEAQEVEAQQAEALAEVFASELWGTLVRDDEFVAMVALICENREIAKLEPTPEQIATGRQLLRELTDRWIELAPGESLEVELE